MIRLRVYVMFVGLLSILGCSKPPTKVAEFRGPANVVYTVETWEDAGGISSDFTRVYAGFGGGTRRGRVLVMDGAYLQIPNIVWSGQNDVTICMAGGRVNSFKSSTTLKASGSLIELKNHLGEHCDSSSTTSPNASN
jgi:hypothetical protein